MRYLPAFLEKDILKHMDQARRILRGILLEQALDPSFITAAANDEDLYPSSIDQEGLTITIQLSKEGEENAIRRFKNKLRIRNPRIERIEVRQPKKGQREEPKDQLRYAEWRKKTLDKLKKLAGRYGWKLYSDPVACKNTDYILAMKGSGANKKVLQIRVSEHPSSKENPDISVDMSKQEASLDDLKARLQQAEQSTDGYPLI